MTSGTSEDTNTPPQNSESKDADRRDFLVKAGSICAGCALVGIPVAAGISVVIDPLRKSSGDADFLQVATMDALPANGAPQKFTVRADQEDAWSRFPDRVIGAIYLRRLPEGGVQAFNVVCPHLGCAIDYRESEHDYFCPCHNSAFELETGTQEPSSPSARGMDSLEVRVEKNGEIWVQFQNFLTGIVEKKPV